MIESEKTSESDQPQAANISQENVRSVQANLVRMHQAAAETIQADEVALNQSAASDIRANSVSAYQAALATVEAAEVHYGVTGVVVGQDVHAEGARVILLVGRNVTGNVTPLLDSRSALIAGL